MKLTDEMETLRSIPSTGKDAGATLTSPTAALLDFIARNRFALAVTCAAAAMFMYRYQLELDPLSLDAIEVREVEAQAIGTLEVQVRGRRDSETVARRDAGFAIEFTSHPPGTIAPARMLFAAELALTDAEIRWIRGHGPRYRVGIARQQIVTIESTTQPLIRYQRYFQLTKAKRDRWRAFGVLTLALGVALYAIGRRHRAKTDIRQ